MCIRDRAQLEQRSAHYARVALASGLRPGDVGAVMIENRPEFFYAWLGLARIGVTAGLINTSALGTASVSYTHLTLPQSDLVEIPGVAVSLKKKKGK